jgi:hypothetical protein
MDFNKFDQFSNEQLQGIAGGKVKGYSRKEINTVRSVLEWRSARNEVSYCTQCGSQMAGGVCPVCNLHMNDQPVNTRAENGSVRNSFVVWIAFAITIFTVLGHAGNATYSDHSRPFNYQHMWASMALYLLGSLFGFKDCRLGSIFYACGLAVDIIGMAVQLGAGVFSIVFGFVFAIIPIIAFIFLLVGISAQKKLRTAGKSK